MKTQHPISAFALLLVSVLVFTTSFIAQGNNPQHQEKPMSKHPEHEAVIAAVNHYLSGLQNPETAKEHLEAAFYSSTNLHTLDEQGGLQFMPRDALVAYASSGELPEHTGEILSVEVTQDMAFAKVHLDMPDRHFYDYLTLLKLNTGWRIVSKTFTTVMK